MNFPRLILITTCIILTLALVSSAGPLEKRHGLGLRLGMWNQVTSNRTEVGIGRVTTSTEASGFFGGLFYDHWLQENLALNITIGGILADFETKTGIAGVSTQTAFVAPILLGVKYYFPGSTLNSSVRPMVKVAVGPFIGQQERTEEGIYGVIVESRSLTVFGGQVGAGVDFILGRYFMLGVGLGYNLMSDFDEPIGGSRNYSGPEFSVGLSLLLGKGVN